MDGDPDLHIFDSIRKNDVTQFLVALVVGSRVYGTRADQRTGGAARGKNVSGDPAHQHQYVTVEVNTPSSTRRIALLG